MGTGTASLLNGPGLDERYARTLNGVTRSYLTDALGSVVGIGSPVGTVNKTYAYEPYGATVTAMSGGVNTYQYTGRENDNTGLYYYRARYYHPRWGRFISSDPIGFAGGDANLYAYVGNNPVSNTDPSGYGPVTGGVCAAFVAGYTVGSFLYTMENLDSTSPLQDQLIRVNKKIGECPAEDTRRLHELDKIRKDLVKALSESVGKAAASNNGLQDVGTAMAVEGICGFLLRAPGP
jgi:RHS repeat-associated protein